MKWLLAGTGKANAFPWIRTSNTFFFVIPFYLQEKRDTAARMGTGVGARGFNAGLLARSQFASGRSCDRPTQSSFSVVFLGPTANAELVPKFHAALHASHVTLPMVTLNISPYINVTLTFDFGLDHLVHGGYV
jgi:hypothetical protein